jgi:hypothetical protein
MTVPPEIAATTICQAINSILKRLPDGRYEYTFEEGHGLCFDGGSLRHASSSWASPYPPELCRLPRSPHNISFRCEGLRFSTPDDLVVCLITLNLPLDCSQVVPLGEV